MHLVCSCWAVRRMSPCKYGRQVEVFLCVRHSREKDITRPDTGDVLRAGCLLFVNGLFSFHVRGIRSATRRGTDRPSVLPPGDGHAGGTPASGCAEQDMVHQTAYDMSCQDMCLLNPRCDVAGDNERQVAHAFQVPAVCSRK